jgi:hypothetical protein
MHPDEEEWDTEPLYCQYEWYVNGNYTDDGNSTRNDGDNGNGSEGMSLIDQIIEYFEDDQGVALGVSVSILAFNSLYL